MYIGFMHTPKNPPLIAKVTAMMGSYYGIDLICLRTKDIDMKNGLVKGKLYKNNKWISVTKELPPLIDANSVSFNRDTREITTYLRNNTVLTFDKKGTPNKAKLQEELYKDTKFADLVIPTERLDSFQTLEKFLIEYSSIIMKPLNGKQGEGIYSLRKQSDSYILSYDKEEKRLSYNKIYEFYKKHLDDKNYILQKMIDSRTVNGDPFDCRIVIQKNRKGKWVIAKIFFRIGGGQKVVSNTSKGGSISDPKPFLKANFGFQWNDIYKNIKKVAITLPYKIEKIKKTPTMDLGLDIGIDKNGDLFLFEANNGASVKRFTSESAILRLEYYQYLINTHPELKGLKELNMEKQTLTKERDFYKNKYNQVKMSRSWRLTSPLRKLGSYIKNRNK